MGVNPVAAGGFSAAADHYRRARPGYAREAVGAIKDAVPAGTVLDVAAGTGILTGQLVRSGRSVVAVEPLAEMLAQLRRALPTVPAARCVAESLPFAAGAVAGVTVAQAFHWFDAPAALGEIGRVLVPHGVLAIVFNVRDTSVPWVRELDDLVTARSGGRPYSDDRERPWEEVIASAGGWSPVQPRRWANPVPSSPELLVERVRSTSYVAVMDQLRRESLLAEVRELVAGDPALAGRDRFEFPHETVLYLCQPER